MTDFVSFAAAILTLVVIFLPLLGFSDLGALKRHIQKKYQQPSPDIEGMFSKERPPERSSISLANHIQHFFTEVAIIRYSPFTNGIKTHLIIFLFQLMPIFFYLIAESSLFLFGVEARHRLFATIPLILISFLWIAYNFVSFLSSDTLAYPTELVIYDNDVKIISPAGIFDKQSNSASFERSDLRFLSGHIPDPLGIRALDTLCICYKVGEEKERALIMCPRWFAKIFECPDYRTFAKKLDELVKKQ